MGRRIVLSNNRARACEEGTNGAATWAEGVRPNSVDVPGDREHAEDDDWGVRVCPRFANQSKMFLGAVS